jgi:hypothetical protein
MDRKRAARLVLLAAGLGVAALLARGELKVPHDQTVRYVLGDEAPRVQELEARWAAPGAVHQPEDWTRAATFRYVLGQAPRVITHEPKLPNGDYDVQIEIVASDATRVVDRHVQLSGGTTSIDLARAVPR